MGQLNYSLPVIGSSAATEDPKVRTALGDIQTWANGNVDATNLAANAVGADEIAAGAVGTAKIADGAVSFAKLAGGVASRLLHAATTPRFSYGANNTANLAAFTVAHTGRASIVVWLQGVTVSGSASPYGWGPRLLLNGSIVAAPAVGSTVLGEFQSITVVHSQGALSGNQTWAVRVETGNNPNTWRNDGLGFFAVFEQ